MKEMDVIRKYLGIPYKHLGRGPKEGLDCWGLIKCIYADAGIQLSDLGHYEMDWSKYGKNYFLENYHQEWHRVDGPQFMDVVLFKMTGEIVNHAGLVLNESRFIHCCRVGVIVSRLGEFNWFKRNAGYYRLRAHDQSQIST